MSSDYNRRESDLGSEEEKQDDDKDEAVGP